MIRLQSTPDKRYQGKTFSYLVVYNHVAGRSDRYEVYITCCDDPVTIGRELDLKTVRNLIEKYESCAATFTDWVVPEEGYCGDREDVLKLARSFWSSGRNFRPVNYTPSVTP